MKRFSAMVLALLMLACVGSSTLASDVASSSAVPAKTETVVSTAKRAVGEVLYHQDFSVLSELARSGIVRGTSGSEKAGLSCTGDTLELNTVDNERVYALLPSSGADGSYTVEFDFSFSDIVSENGYLGYILTCRGTEPTNVTAVVIRASGKIDDFEEPDEELKKAISSGEKIGVRIPIENDVFHELELTVGGKSYTLERDNVKVLEDGGSGYVVRNASVEIGEIYIVNGVGYTKKTGTYAKSSYASDAPVTVSNADIGTDTSETSPDTGDCTVPYAIAALALAMGLFGRLIGSAEPTGSDRRS